MQNHEGRSFALPPTLLPVLDLPEVARTTHLRRQLAAAVDHGTALLAALGLPRLVTPDFMPLDPIAIGDALDHAIATLDAIDGDAEREDEGEAEPSFGWDARPSQIVLWNGCIQGDLELDTADAEPTAPERAGRDFVRCGPDDAEEDDPAEDSDPAERDEEHGSDDAEDIGHHASQYAPRPLSPKARAEVAVIAARLAQVRRTLQV